MSSDIERTFTHKLGEGKYSEVFKGDIEGEEYAIKRLQRKAFSSGYLESLKNELQILQSLRHPNIIRLKDKARSTEFYYLVMEYCAGGGLDEWIQKGERVPELVLQALAFDICRALDYIHSKGIIHRDVKPQNIVISSSETGIFKDDMWKGHPQDVLFKLADFGFAKVTNEEGLTRGITGTPLFMAPEILASSPYSTKVDIWALGIMMFQLLSGETPFQGFNLSGLRMQVHNGEYLYPEGVKPSMLCKHFISCCLQGDPSQRYSADDLLKHPFLKDIKILKTGVEDQSDYAVEDCKDALGTMSIYEQYSITAVEKVQRRQQASSFIQQREQSILEEEKLEDKASSLDNITPTWQMKSATGGAGKFRSNLQGSSYLQLQNIIHTNFSRASQIRPEYLDQSPEVKHPITIRRAQQPLASDEKVDDPEDLNESLREEFMNVGEPDEEESFTEVQLARISHATPKQSKHLPADNK